MNSGECRDQRPVIQRQLGRKRRRVNTLGWFPEALPPLRHSLEPDPNFAFSHWQLGRAYWLLGDREAVLVELHQAVEFSGRLPPFLSILGQALALPGEVGQARQIQRELAERTLLAPTRPYHLSHLHAALGENDLAFAAQEQALNEGSDSVPTSWPSSP